MTNKELIAAVSAKTALSEQASREVLNTILETIQDAVWDGDKVTLTNFGYFYLAERKARPFAKPKAHMPLIKPARKYPKFVPSPNFEELVR